MADILGKIEGYKRREIADAKVRMPFATLERKAREHDPTRGPRNAPLRDGVRTSARSTSSQRAPPSWS